jgi:predicted AlkP superfamily phosphohydrolase/phosphomutase
VRWVGVTTDYHLGVPVPMRVLALGLSECSWNRLRDPRVAPHMPWLHRMAGSGMCGRTCALQPLDPTQMWATVVTGRSPRGHHLFGSVTRRRDGSFRSLSADDLASPPIWRMLETAGIPTGTFNLTITRRPETATGFMIARGTAPYFERSHVSPPSLYEPLRRRFGAWPVDSIPESNDDWSSLVPQEFAARTDVLVDLLESRPWRFVLAQLPEVSRAQHRFWAHGEDSESRCHQTLPSVYAAADRAMARIVEAAGPETVVFVFSECGAGPVRHALRLDAWLEQHGFLSRIRDPLGSTRAWSTGRARTWWRTARRTARRVFPKSVSGRMVDAAARAKHASGAWARAHDLDWTRTRAYSVGTSGAIYFNIAGRDPQGVVPAHERARLTGSIRSGLLAMRDPEGRRVVEDVIPHEACDLDGPLPPDLTIVWDDDAYVPAAGADNGEGLFADWYADKSDWRFTGTHRREGMLLICGRGVEAGDLGSVGTIDLAPTWLDLLGVPAGNRCEGSSFAGTLIARGLR